MKKNICLIVLAVSVLIFIRVAVAQDISIFGITLGKSLKEVGIRQCNVNSYGWAINEGSICYTTGTISNNRVYVPELQDYTDWVHVYSEDKDPDKPVHSILISIKAKDAEMFLRLVSSKFKEPKTLDTSRVQNRMGASFDNFVALWNIKGTIITLMKRSGTVDSGGLTATHRNQVDKDLIESEYPIKKLKDKF